MTDNIEMIQRYDDVQNYYGVLSLGYAPVEGGGQFYIGLQDWDDNYHWSEIHPELAQELEKWRTPGTGVQVQTPTERANTMSEVTNIEDADNIPGESKSEAFSRLANYRLHKLVKRMRQMRNLANKSNYEYSQAQVDALMASIRAEADKLEASFSISSDEEMPTI